MLPEAPFALILLFFGITVAAIILLFASLKKVCRTTALLVTAGMIAWCLLQSIFAYTDFYRDYQCIPPNFLIAGVFPLLLVIGIVLIYPATYRSLLLIPLVNLTWIHIVRIPVEFGLLWLFSEKLVPQLMTIEGYNFDIIAGISAPFIAYYGIFKKKMSRRLLLVWNIISLLLLLNIVGIAILSAPFPFQQLGSGQSNIAVFYFPFILWPTVIVPIVLFAHLVAIVNLCTNKRKIISNKQSYKFAA
jgi:hypothetical protein